ncbi:NADP-dependent alcohol dehydrogenase [Xylogone sp. PMI_703]|nr:NADP-dependent alcohol dehydrogenase [Xylogone sp. PMI_703]
MGIDFTVFKGSKSGEIVEAKGHREVGPSEALVEITHSGVCGTDEHFRHYDQGLGHEGVGVIKELGSDAARISDFKIGDRVGFGWMHYYCLHCVPCLSGDHYNCEQRKTFGTANWDQGSFSNGVAWDVSALIKIPDEIASEHAGPLMCGGATVWGPLFEQGFRPGDRIGVVGVGGLGHLAIQFGSKMGHDIVVFSGTEAKREEALNFGASEFYTTKGITKFEGIKPVNHLLITGSVLPDLNTYLDILAPSAKIFPLTISMEPYPVPVLGLIGKTLSIVGSAGAKVQSTIAMLRFATRHDIKPQIEKFPMTQKGVTEAMEKLNKGEMRYRGVLEV